MLPCGPGHLYEKSIKKGIDFFIILCYTLVTKEKERYLKGHYFKRNRFAMTQNNGRGRQQQIEKKASRQPPRKKKKKNKKTVDK